MNRSRGTFPANGAVNSCGGFTLLELVIVLVLIGILLVVSVPALRNTLVGDPLRTTARRLIGTIDTLRDKAVREQQGYLIYFDLDQNRLWHLPEAEAKTEEVTPPETGILSLEEGVRFRDVWMKGTGAISRGICEFWVSRQGYTDETVIHLENDDGDTISLVVSPFLPGLEVKDGYYEPEQK